MQKRVFKFGAAMAAVAFALTACGGGGTDAAPEAANEDPGSLETTIKILAPSYADSSKADWDAITAKFNEEYPNVTVELQIEGWEDFANKVQARIQANDYPDILNDNAFASSAEAGLLIPMDQLLDEETLGTIDPTLLENGKGADGTLYATPDIASARMLAYNKDLFEQAGIAEPPKSWEEFEAAAKAISDLGDDIHGYGMPLGQEEAQVESSLWLWGAGGDWNDGENLKADKPEAIEAFTQMKKIYDAGLTQPNLEDNRQDTTDLFSAGKLGMVIGHGQVVSDASAKGIEVGLAPVPSKDGKGIAVGVTDFVLAFNNDDPKRQQATAAYLKYFYQDDLYETWYKNTALLPVTTTMIEKATGEAEGTDKDLLEALKVVKFQPVSNPQWDTLQAALKANAYKISSEEPQALLEQVEAQVAAQS